MEPPPDLTTPPKGTSPLAAPHCSPAVGGAVTHACTPPPLAASSTATSTADAAAAAGTAAVARILAEAAATAVPAGPRAPRPGAPLPPLPPLPGVVAAAGPDSAPSLPATAAAAASDGEPPARRRDDGGLEDHVAFHGPAAALLTAALADATAASAAAEAELAIALRVAAAAEAVVRRRFRRLPLPPTAKAAAAAAAAAARDNCIGSSGGSGSADGAGGAVGDGGNRVAGGSGRDGIGTCGDGLSPVGILYSAFTKRYEAPRQPFTPVAGAAIAVFRAAAGAEVDAFLIRLAARLAAMPAGTGAGAGTNPEEATGAAVASSPAPPRLWLLYWLDRNGPHWRPQVRPPRAAGGYRVGLFATRSPHRPTPVGLSLAAVTGVDVRRRSITLAGVDILDETPLLGGGRVVRSGWLDAPGRVQGLYYDEDGSGAGGGPGHAPGEGGTALSAVDAADGSTDSAPYAVTVLPAAAERLAWVNARSAADVPRLVTGSLSRWPLSSSATRPGAAGASVTAAAAAPGESFAARSPPPPHLHHRLFPVGAYRVTYEVDAAARSVVVTGVLSAMRGEVVAAEGGVDPEAAEHRAFVAEFGSDGRGMVR
ncbi:hypothetical protein MMPV_000721 [Pyropia vietnamensis]